MTSDTAGSQTSEQTYLNYALGLERVHLSRLSDTEFLEFLYKELGSVELSELRGFVKLRELLAQHGADECVTMAMGCKFTRVGRDDLSLDTQVMRAHRGALSVEIVYRRHESDESTTDWHVANSWGRSAYKSKGTATLLLLARTPNGQRTAANNLVYVTYTQTKVPHKNEYLVTEATAEACLLKDFRARHGEKAGEVARDIIWEMRSIISRTHDALTYQALEMRKNADRWQHLSSCISE